MAQMRHSQLMDIKETELTLSATTAAVRGTTSQNAGPRAVTKKDNALLTRLIIMTMIIIVTTGPAAIMITTVAATTGTITRTAIKIMPVLLTQILRHGQQWNMPRLPLDKSMMWPTLPCRLHTV